MWVNDRMFVRDPFPQIFLENRSARIRTAKVRPVLIARNKFIFSPVLKTYLRSVPQTEHFPMAFLLSLPKLIFCPVLVEECVALTAKCDHIP